MDDIRARDEYKIIIPQQWWRRGWEYGHKAVAAFNDENRSGAVEASRKLVSGWGEIHTNPRMQAVGRLCEIAFCLVAGAGPDKLLNWSNEPDHGYDLKLNEIRIDIKGSAHPRARRLLWPDGKNWLFDRKAFDVLVFVRLDMQTREAVLGGWVTKEDFRRYHTTADGSEGMKAGTWYMPARGLYGMEILFNELDSIPAPRIDAPAPAR